MRVVWFLSAASIALAALLIAAGLSYYSLEARYRALESIYDELRAECAELNARYLELNSSYVKLIEDYDKIKQRYSALSANYTSLREKYDSLKKSYQLLENDYRLLKENYASLKEDYEKLMAEYEKVSAGYERLEENLSEMRRSLELIAERILLPPDFFPKILGQSLSLEVVALTRDELGLSKEMASELKAREIAEWIAVNTQYFQDDYHQYIVDEELETKMDFASAPNETLSRGGGDCEDLAILAYAMLKSVLDEGEAVYLIAATNGEEAHAAVLYKARDKFMIIDPAMDYVTDARIVLAMKILKDDLEYLVWISPMALSHEVKWFLLEKDLAEISYYDPWNPPERSLTAYEFLSLDLTVNLWLDYVDAVIPGAYVALIADESGIKTFNSTQEFLDWMRS